MRLHTMLPSPPPANNLRTIEYVPDEKLGLWSLRLFAIQNLAWDYIDTICDICILYRTDNKGLVRTVRNLKREYDRFRCGVIDKSFEEEETSRGIKFENYYKKDLAKAFNAFKEESELLGLSGVDKEIYIATQQSLLLMDIAKLYAKWCDHEISKYGVWTCTYCMVQDDFLKLYPIIPLFIADVNHRDSDTRCKMAKMLYSRLHIFGKHFNSL